MSTAAKAAANARNAQHSTGPRTGEGQARSAQNAVTHGLTAQKIIVPPDRQAEFDEFHQALRAEIAPQGPLEQTSFDQLLHAAWKAESVSRMEEQLLLGGLETIRDDETARIMDRLNRYGAAAHRAYSHALKELRALQTDRGLRQTIPDETVEAIPTLASLPAMTRQIHDMDRNAEFKIEQVIDAIENTPMPGVRPRQFHAEEAAA